jgi:hypothetical protein
VNLAKMVCRSVVPTLTLLAVPLVLAAPASAQTLRGSDPGHDVHKFDTATFSQHRAAGQADADLKRYSLRYRGATIRVVEQFRALDHSEPLLAVGGSFKLPGGTTRDLIVRAQKGNWGGTAKLERRPECGVTHHLDYANARAVITVPATCLGTPDWVRFQFDAVTTDSWRNPSYLYADVAPGTSIMRTRYTPRIHRG